jgi:RNA polymerase sigma-70 factor, ECF subfamily
MGMKDVQPADIEDLFAHAGWLRRFAFALVRDEDEANDLAQQAMLAAWRRPPKPASRAWFARVTRNLALNRFRGARRRESREQAADAIQPGRVATPEELIGEAQIHRQVAEVVAGLPEPLRQTIVLRFYEGQSCADIARGLGVPEGTVRWRLKQGLDRARRELDVRHGDKRSVWVAALAPLVPRPWPGKHVPGQRPTREPRGLSAGTCLAIATLGASVVSLVVFGAGVHSWGAGTSGVVETIAPTPMEADLPASSPSPVRLNLASQPVLATQQGAEPSPGPGRADAQSLAEELLEAIERNDYDSFVAKGSAYFRAALPTRGFASLSAALGGRLARGRHVSLLGSVRRTQIIDWLLKIEFADGNDDGLVTLTMDGWQVAGFLIDTPTTPPEEK